MTEVSRRPKWMIVYEAMQNGKEIEFPDGLTYALVEDTLCIRLAVYQGISKLPTVDAEPDEYRYVKCDISLNQFIQDCEEFTDDDLMGLIMVNVMHKTGHLKS